MRTDLPTFKEQGYDLEASVWFGLCAPASMPPALIKKINEAVVNGLAKPDVISRMRTDGIVTDPMSPSQFNAFIDKEAKVWAPILQTSGLIEKKN
jgi:tripartite-type tricarboxylate transporter receptor subunit TctC